MTLCDRLEAARKERESLRTELLKALLRDALTDEQALTMTTKLK